MDPATAARIAQLEHLLELERARRQDIDRLERLSERCHALAREKAALREQLGPDLSLPEAV